MQWKTVHDGEWVKVRSFLNQHFGKDSMPVCEICKKMSCAPAWYSIKTQKWRCIKCFTPNDLK
jgi:hypothetical protein